jgi:tetrapyrrole methylase family protein/MazG family protein/ATP diphosphatase
VNPAVALHRANRKFYRRFGYIEEEFARMGKAMSPDELELMEQLWNEAKSLEK